MLIGRYNSSLTDKKRLAFPAKLRAKIGNSVVVTQGYEKSLIAVAERNWSSLIEGSGKKPFILGSARDTVRFLLGSAQVIKLDKQGRFVLPEYLLEYAQIKNQAVFLGLGTYVEIWDSRRWEEYQKKLEMNIEDISDKLAKLSNV